MTILSDRELFLIRHAATDMNGRLCGQIDPPLNELGRTQAKELAFLLQRWDLGCVYTSDLQRALQTAQIVAELDDVSVSARRDLREISFGDWEGRRWSELRAEGADIKGLESLPGLSAPGGETFTSFRDRVAGALSQMLAESTTSRIAVVTHLGVMRVILREICSTNRLWEPQQRIECCSVFRIRVNGSGLELIGELK